jgi:hypothetical protein
VCVCKRINILLWKEKYARNNILLSFLLRNYILNERSKQKTIKKKEKIYEIELTIPSYLLEKPYWKAHMLFTDRSKIPNVSKLSSTQVRCMKVWCKYNAQLGPNYASVMYLSRIRMRKHLIRFLLSGLGETRLSKS